METLCRCRFETDCIKVITSFTKGKTNMGAKDKGKKEQKKKAQHNLKEKRKLKQEKKNQ